MKFGPVPVARAEGAILAHSIGIGARRLRKAHRLTASDLADLAAAGISEVIAAVLDADDVGEDEAAAELVAAMSFTEITPRRPATGRVNLHADSAGVFTVDAAVVDALNAIDPAITLATLAHHAPADAGQMVATVKIIPYAVNRSVLDRAIELVRGRPIFAVNAYRPADVAVIQTTMPGLKPAILDKTLGITRDRLSRSGSAVTSEVRVSHNAIDIAEAIRAGVASSDLVIVFGASAVSDFDDAIPAAIRAAGGTVTRTGMPVDPGNLLVLGSLDGKPVIGAPGCARSPKENGFDWVLDRTLAGIDITARDIAGMGVGGLLMEIPTRPQPRELRSAPGRAKVHAVVLAAGRASRMGGPNKLLAEFGGEPLVRRTVMRALGSSASSVVVVTGHQSDRVSAALRGLQVQLIENPDFASGLAASLKRGVAALPSDADGALIVLGDMPGVSSADLTVLIEAFRKNDATSIVRATHGGKRGNPVILPRTLFSAVQLLEGDVGARHLVESGGADIVDVELGAAALLDVDTPEAMVSAGGVLKD